MIKSFVWTLIFWSLFVLFNTISDAILFYSVFPWYNNMDLWHFLKYFWIGFAVLTGVFANELWYDVTKVDIVYGIKKSKIRLKRFIVFAFLLLWFLLLRWGLHEGLMEIWRTP